MKTAYEVHERLKTMTETYGIMMQGLDAEFVGKNKAEACLEGADLSLEEDDLCKPTNSCGDVSNQICALLLDGEKYNVFKTQPYEVLDRKDLKLLHQVEETPDLLVRFETDRPIFKFVYIDTSINSVEKLNNLNKELKRYLVSNKGLVLIGDTLYRPRFDGEAEAIESDEREKEALGKFFTENFDGSIVALASPLGTDETMLTDITNRILVKSECDWTSTHSFTVLFTRSDDGSIHPFHYQAYMGKHTLQQWFQGERYRELSTKTPDEYIEYLTNLVEARGSDEVKQKELAIFSRGGDEQRRLSTSLTATAPERMRIKFKCTPIDPVVADENLSTLQRVFDERYPKMTPEQQTKRYSDEATEAFREKLGITSTIVSDPTTHQEPSENTNEKMISFKTKYQASITQSTEDDLTIKTEVPKAPS